MRQSSALVLTFAVTLGGCVGKLETRPNREFTSPNAALEGKAYALPTVRYEVKLTRTLAECPGELVDGKPTALKFSIGAAATPTFVAGESYTVDYMKLPGWLRTASFDMKLYPNGTLKSIGAVAEDKTAEVIDNVAKTAFSMATIVGLSAGDEVTIPPPANLVLCKPAAAKMVKEARDIEGSLKMNTALLATYEKNAERLRAAGSARLIDKAGRDSFLKLYDDIRTVEDDVANLKRRQEELNDALGVSDDIVWNGSYLESSYNKDYSPSTSQQRKLAGLLEIGPAPSVYPTDAAESKRRGIMTNCYDAGSDVNTCVLQQVKVRGGLYLDRGLPKCGEAGADRTECLTQVTDGEHFHAARDSESDSGIFVREPMAGRLLFCRTAVLKPQQPAVAPALQTGPTGSTGSQPTTSGTGTTGTTGGGFEGEVIAPPGQAAPPEPIAPAATECDVEHDEAKIAAGDFPQFGQLRFLPFKVGTFQTREMSISLTEAGRIDAFTYKSTKAPAEALAATAANVTSKYQAFLEARETERRDDEKYAGDNEFALLDQQISLLTKQDALKKLQTPPEVDALKPMRDETATIQAELALLNAKLERLKTERALAELQQGN